MQTYGEQRVKELKKYILKASYETKEGHVPSSFSILDILYVLYHQVLKVDAAEPCKRDRDYCIVSKGHAAAGQYAVLADMGFFPMKELLTFGMHNSRLGGHPDWNKVPGVEASTGSLGHGMPMAVGLAMACRIKQSSQKVYCIVGDGEMNEGSVWEGIIIAGERKLENLICILDFNHSLDRCIGWGNMEDKFRCFGWEALCIDGHDHRALHDAFTRKPNGKPLAIIANTVKGKGCKTMEQNPFAWHHRAPNAEEMERFLEEIEL